MIAPLLLAAVVAGAAPAEPAGPAYYRVELAGGRSAWAMGKPQPNGALLLFRHYPEGSLMSVRTRDVKRIVAGSPPETIRRLKPGEIVEIGATGGGIAAGGGQGAAGGQAAAVPPGARRDGSALFNPDRKYNPSWDSKLVPGATMPYPGSPNDYVEGKTLAHPPAAAVQSAPGDVPRAPEPPHD